MNQFKIGDTVWTAKRGKGRIVSNHYEHTGYRPFNVIFEGYAYSRSPKLSNLYRTEAEMIEAKRKAEFLRGKRTVTISMDSFIPITVGEPFCFEFKQSDPPQPKFKRGDKVYYEGKKWEVCDYHSGRSQYVIVKLPDLGQTGRWADESNLRLWKEHEFVLKVGSESTGVYKTECTVPTNTKYSVKYIGKHMHTGMDTLILTYSDGTIDIFLGKKGDIEI